MMEWTEGEVLAPLLREKWVGCLAALLHPNWRHLHRWALHLAECSTMLVEALTHVWYLGMVYGVCLGLVVVGMLVMGGEEEVG